MSSNFDVAITRSVPLIHDFDDFDPALSPIETSGSRSEIRMRFNFDAHKLIHGFNDRSSPRTGSSQIAGGRSCAKTIQAHFARQFFQRSDPILGRWMGGE